MTGSAFRPSTLGLVLGLLAGAGTRGDDKKDEMVDLRVGDMAPGFEARTDANASRRMADAVGRLHNLLPPQRTRTRRVFSLWCGLLNLPGSRVKVLTTTERHQTSAFRPTSLSGRHLRLSNFPEACSRGECWCRFSCISSVRD